MQFASGLDEWIYRYQDEEEEGCLVKGTDHRQILEEFAQHFNKQLEDAEKTDDYIMMGEL